MADAAAPPLGPGAVVADPVLAARRRSAWVNIGVTTAVSTLTYVALLPAVDHIWVTVWWLAHMAMVGLQVGRLMIRRRVRASGGRVGRGGRTAVATAVVSGVTWGASALFLDALEPSYRTFLLGIVIGMISGSATTLAAIPAAAFAFIFCTSAPYAVVFLMQGDAINHVLAVISVLYPAAMVFSSRSIYQMIAHNRRLRDENLGLLARIGAAQRQLLDVAESVEAFALYDAHGRVILWNRRFAELVGGPADPPPDGPPIGALLARIGLRAPGGDDDARTVRSAIPHVLPDGRSLLPVRRRTPQGDTALILIDVTEQQAAAERLSAQNRRLEELYGEVSRARDAAEAASRAKSAFLANMSHELRTPLNAIIGFSDIIAHRRLGGSSPKYDDYVRDIHASGVHLLDIINDILDLARVEANRIDLAEENVRLDEEIAIAVKLVGASPDAAGKALEVTVEPGLPALRGDARLLRQVMLNLAGNALKFSPAGAGVRIDVRRGAEGGIRVAVRDQGIGIAPDDRDRIFLPFERARGATGRRFAGVGLGLALVRAYVEAHQGTIAVESAPGHGTEIIVRLPAARVVAA